MEECRYQDCHEPISIKSRQVCTKHNRKERRDAGRERCLAYLGGKCAECETTEHLEFDHIDPSTVLFRISQKFAWPFETIKPELDKCQLLCKKHHALKTNIELGNYDPVTLKRIERHGTYRQYIFYNCRCDECRRVWNERTLKYYPRKT